MRSLQITVIIVLGAFVLTGCGMSKETLDSDYTSTENTRAIENGISSWYGPNFHGKLTANGEIYDMNGITAAHRTLPFGTILLVENLDNGKTIQVRINDRGPYAKNRIIDLSKGAAEKIEMIGPGTARVRLYLLEGDLENSRVTDLKVPTYTVQLGSYKDIQQAELQVQQIDGTRIETIEAKDNTFYRVYYGTYTDPEEARHQMQRLNDMGFAGFVKQIEN
ncbi:septal ring lytic transglycosylase RlpA family protein [Gracilimonas sp. Q87]|uniref:septal ring lytic transglycosylase RlpA family protein n=1 Tax=Gracilimonas sp. Q87 TaxID=3384766 RepID=UPI00398407E4